MDISKPDRLPEGLADLKFGHITPPLGSQVAEWQSRYEGQGPRALGPHMAIIKGTNYVGKTTTIHELLRAHPDEYTRVRKHTSRPRRPDDEDRDIVPGVSEEEMIERGLHIRQSESGIVYGIDLNKIKVDIEGGKIPVADTSTLIEGLTVANSTIYLLPDDIKTWYLRRAQRMAAGTTGDSPELVAKRERIALAELEGVAKGERNPSSGVNFSIINPQGDVQGAAELLHGLITLVKTGDKGALPVI